MCIFKLNTIKAIENIQSLVSSQKSRTWFIYRNIGFSD